MQNLIFCVYNVVLDILILEIIIFENYCQNLKVHYRSNTYQAVSNAFLMRDC